MTRKFLEYWDGFDLNLVAAVSPEDPDDPQPIGRWQFVEAPNIPLSDKFQAAVDAAPKSDGYLFMGSDDFADAGFVDRVQELMEAWQLIQPQDLFMYEPPSEVAYYCAGWDTGAGRVLRRDLLEKAGGQVWPKGLNRGLDKAAWNHIAPHAESIYYYLHRDESTILVDYKTGGNMWGLQETLRLLPIYRKMPAERVLPSCLR